MKSNAAEKDKIEEVTSEKVLECIGEKRTLLNNILLRRVNWIGHILRRNCFLFYEIEEQITDVKGIGRGKCFLDYLENRGRMGAKGTKIT